MSTKLFDNAIVGTEQALDFISNILESIHRIFHHRQGSGRQNPALNEGARRLYGYEPEEVVGRVNSSILHTPEDVRAGRHREMIAVALRDGKWEGTIQRVRKNGEHFTARVVMTPHRDSQGKPMGLLLISKDISDEIRLNEELQGQSPEE